MNAAFDDHVVNAEQIAHSRGVLTAGKDFSVLGDCTERKSDDVEPELMESGSGLGKELLKEGTAVVGAEVCNEPVCAGGDVLFFRLGGRDAVDDCILLVGGVWCSADAEVDEGVVNVEEVVVLLSES